MKWTTRRIFRKWLDEEVGYGRRRFQECKTSPRHNMIVSKNGYFAQNETAGSTLPKRTDEALRYDAASEFPTNGPASKVHGPG